MQSLIRANPTYEKFSNNDPTQGCTIRLGSQCDPTQGCIIRLGSQCDPTQGCIIRLGSQCDLMHRVV